MIKRHLGILIIHPLLVALVVFLGVTLSPKNQDHREEIPETIIEVPQVREIQPQKNTERKTETVKLNLDTGSRVIPLTIKWIFDDTRIPECLFTEKEYQDPNFNNVCFVALNNTIYISRELDLIDIKRDWSLFHEIGHAIFLQDFPKELFVGDESRPNYEVVVDQFAWWIYAQKYPEEVERWQATLLPSEEQTDFFKQGCDENCVKQIIGIKIK